MAFLNLFQKSKKEKKRDKKQAKPTQTKKKPVKEQVEEKSASSVAEKKQVVARHKTKGKLIAHKVLISPRITEKATALGDYNQYIFKVETTATKQEIKKAIEQVYGADVAKVRTINVLRKKKRLGRTFGWTQGYKKAIVSIRKGQTLDVLPR